jgi:hypothetical protein
VSVHVCVCVCVRFKYLYCRVRHIPVIKCTTMGMVDHISDWEMKKEYVNKMLGRKPGENKPCKLT